MDHQQRRSSTVRPGHLRLVPPRQQFFSLIEQVVVIALRGSLTELSVPMVRAHLLSLVGDDGPVEIIVDLQHVSDINEAGARPLLEAHRRQHVRHAFLSLGQISSSAADFLETHPPFAALLAPGGAVPSPLGWPAERRLHLAGTAPGTDEYPGA